MENSRHTSWNDQDAAHSLLTSDRHYLDAIARMGDGNDLIAANDIVGSQGIKLIAEGTRIDSRIIDKLYGHHLGAPLDQQLSAPDGLTPAGLAQDSTALMDENPWWGRMLDRSGDTNRIRDGLRLLSLPPSLCLKLAVARDQRATLYRHSLRTALLAHYLALRLRFDQSATDRLIIAALCHDLGELHTDPAILDARHRITDTERRFIYVHPITGYLILRQVPNLDPEIALAVLHHQERLDGSGYPSGLRGPAISPLARILTVADIAESVLARFADHRRLSVLLRLNTRKYDNHAIAELQSALIAAQMPDEEPLPPEPGTLCKQLTGFAETLAAWSRLRAMHDSESGHREGEGLSFLFERIHGLNSTLLQFGFDPDSIETLAALAGSDREIAGEMAAVLGETQFQFAEMAQEIDRREEDGSLRIPAALQAGFAAWREQLKMLRTGA